MTTTIGFTSQLRSFIQLFWTPSRAVDDFADMKSPWAVQWVLILVQLALLAVTYQFTLDVSAHLLPVDLSPFWWQMLGAFNLPELLMIAFLGWAFCRLAKGVEPSAAYASLGGLWITWVLLRSLSAASF